MFSWDNTSPELAAARPEIALLPIGSAEQHGPHLPLATDSIIAAHLARLVAEKLGAFLLPVIPVSNSQEHQDFFGSLWIQPDTLARVVTDIVESLKHHGFRKVVVLSTHGGNWVLKPAVRSINLNDPSMSVVLAPLEAVGTAWGKDNQIHACKLETSIMLHLHPELVKGRGVDCNPGVPQGYLDYVGMKGCSPSGVWGTPSAASPELGHQFLTTASDALTAYILSTFDFIARSRNGK